MTPIACLFGFIYTSLQSLILSILGLEFTEHLLWASLCSRGLLGLCREHPSVSWLPPGKRWVLRGEIMGSFRAYGAQEKLWVQEWRAPNTCFPCCPGNCSHFQCERQHVKGSKVLWVSQTQLNSWTICVTLAQLPSPGSLRFLIRRWGEYPVPWELLPGLKGGKVVASCPQ